MSLLLKIKIIGVIAFWVLFCPSSFAKNVWWDLFGLLDKISIMDVYADNRKYDEACWLTSHNSFAYEAENPMVNKQEKDYHCRYDIKRQYFAYQEKNILKQLSYGVRSFMVDLHLDRKNIFIAHRLEVPGTAGKLVKTLRFEYFYRQPLKPFLDTIRWWLDTEGNEGEIITIHLESYVRDYEKIIKEIKKAGLYDYLFDKSNYTDSKQTSFVWPTLGQMRKENNRLIIFSDKDEDLGYGIMSVSGTMETQYDLQEYPGCEMRKEGRAQKASLFVMNHFSQFSILRRNFSWEKKSFGKSIRKTNKYEDVHKRVCLCKKAHGKFPNFISYSHVGDNTDDRKIVVDINKIKKGEEELFCRYEENSSSDQNVNNHDEL